MPSINSILIKRNNLSGTEPNVSDLTLGELALNTADGKLFIRTETADLTSISTFLNSKDLPYVLNESLSSINTQHGGNTVSQVFGAVLGGYKNDNSGGGSTVINGENNDIDADFSAIVTGLDNKIAINADYSVILGGKNNLISHENSFTIGSNLSSHANNFTYVNNISAQGVMYGDGSGLTNLAAAAAPDLEVRSLTANWESTYNTVSSLSAAWASSSEEYLPLSGGALSGTILGDLSATGSFYGDGSKLTGIVAGDTVATTLVRSNSANWDSVYTSYNANSASIDASYITSGTLNASRLPTFNGDITADTSAGSVSATVVAIQGKPISVQTPTNGQTLQWNGTAWTPGAIPNGGSGGGGLVYYLNYANAAQTPTTNLPSTPNTPKELGITCVVGSSSYTLTNVSTTNYDLICGFVSLTASPNTTTIPAGLWDFNIWADATSTTTNQMILRLDVYKYDGSNYPTLLASSGDIYIYDPVTTAQYIASVVFPQTTLSTTDRIYLELRAKATKNNKDVTIYFGGTSPTHVHTTFPSVGGSGLLKVIDGVYQTPASLLVNTDVAANAAIDQSKINGLTDVANKANSTYTTVNTNSATNWNYQGTDLKSLSSGWVGGNSAFTTVQSNSATNWNYQGTDLKGLSGNWQGTYTTVQGNSAVWGTAGAIPATDVQIFTSSGTWTKPTGAKSVHVIVIGAGGGGASGRVTAGTHGGGAGAGGGLTERTIPATSLGSTETVTVGLSGAGGTSQTLINSGNGVGGAGGNSTFGSFVIAGGGNGGGATGTPGSASLRALWVGIAGSSGGTNAAGGSGAFSVNGAAGGGGGGGQDGANPPVNQFDGGLGGIVFSNSISVGQTVQGVAPGGNGSNAPANISYVHAGNGGGGGASNKAGNGGRGGSGGLYGGGGGGGGACAFGYSSGAGGNGANGVVVVTTYF